MIAILGDTHLPKGRRRLPERCLELLASAEAVIHTGDFVAAEILFELQTLNPTVHAVHGNVDEPYLRDSLSETLEIDVEGTTVGLIHDAGPAASRLARMRGRFPGAAAVVFGHSHLPLHEADHGFQIFNPGSPTERRRALRHSMGLLALADGELHFEHVWLDP